MTQVIFLYLYFVYATSVSTDARFGACAAGAIRAAINDRQDAQQSTAASEGNQVSSAADAHSLTLQEADAAVTALCGCRETVNDPRVRPRGLVNPGNYCFVNASLQVL